MCRSSENHLSTSGIGPFFFFLSRRKVVYKYFTNVLRTTVILASQENSQDILSHTMV